MKAVGLWDFQKSKVRLISSGPRRESEGERASLEQMERLYGLFFRDLIVAKQRNRYKMWYIDRQGCWVKV